MPSIASLHPLIVHAPLVLIPAAVVFTLLSLLWAKGGLRLAAVLLLAAGVATAVLATETGEAAEHRAEQLMPDLEDIRDAGVVPQAVAEGSLLETHAQLGEMTRNIYGLLLLIEGGTHNNSMRTGVEAYRQALADLFGLDAKGERVGVVQR